MTHFKGRAPNAWFWVAGLGLIFACLAAAPAQVEAGDLPRHYYLSTQGDDGWSGGLPAPNGGRTDGPWATLTHARDAIRALKASGQFHSAVVVMIEGGTYRLSEPVVWESQDGGTSEQPITYTAYPGDHPVLSGGRVITGWTPYRGKIQQAALSEVKAGRWKFRELYANGANQIRARWPKFDPSDPLYGGWAFVADTIPPPVDRKARQTGDGASVFRYEDGVPAPGHWSKPTQAELKVFPWYCWIDDLIPITKIDAAGKIITLARPVQPTDFPLLRGNRFYVENVLEELNQPGEWCLDSESGTLYFWPPGGSMAGMQVVAPVTDRLLELRGTPEVPIRHLTISGLTLTQTRSTWPEQRQGNFHSPGLRGEAIRLENAEDCAVENNLITHVGGDGVRLQGTSARNRVIGNEIANVGAHGVTVASGGGINTGFWANAAEMRRTAAGYPKAIGNLIANNHIHHTGTIKKNGGAIQFYAVDSVDNVIAHNLIHDTADKGIAMQDGYGRFLIEDNEIHDVCHEICDTGAIMTNRWHLLEGDAELGGRIAIRHNLIRNVVGCGAYDDPREGTGALQTRAGGKMWTPYYTWGIYFDNSGMDRDVYDNIVIGTVLGGITMAVGNPKNNVFENNILIGSSAYQFDLRIGAGHEGGGGGAIGNRFVHNIVYSTRRGAALLHVTDRTPPAIAECNANVYFAASGEPLKVVGLKGGRLEDWRALGFDRDSIVADPLFVDPAHGDYRLKPESPAYRLGFHPIETDSIGLQTKVGL